jgi:hypothetical protein
VAGVGALLALTCSACGDVDVAPTTVSGAERAACERLVEGLPERVSDQARRETSGNPLGAAWGDPAIVLRCGVGTPEGYDKFSGCQTVNDLDWFVPTEDIEDQEADVTMTTLGREPAVEVVVPATYRPPDAVMVDLADAIKTRTRVLRRCS